MLTVLNILASLILIGGIGIGVLRYAKYFSKSDKARRRYGDEAKETPSLPSLKLPVLLLILGLFALVALSGATQIPATHMAVVENTWTGQLYTLGPGTHIWPFEPRLTPLVTKVSAYDLRRQIIVIGAFDERGNPNLDSGVRADSNSPGRPTVDFWGRGWAYPNPETLVELHRKYGATYLDTWVERVWISSLKATQGSRPYDFVGNYRAQFENLVEESLQQQLTIEGRAPLVFVSQLSVVNFEFDPNIEGYLNTVAQKEFERQGAEQDILINQKKQEAAEIAVETQYIITKRTAEAEKAKRIAEAEGQGQAQERLADATAYEILKKYEAEAEGIEKVQQALADASESYLEYRRILQWSGDVPTYWGGGALPIINIGGPQP